METVRIFLYEDSQRHEIFFQAMEMVTRSLNKDLQRIEIIVNDSNEIQKLKKENEKLKEKIGERSF